MNNHQDLYLLTYLCRDCGVETAHLEDILGLCNDCLKSEKLELIGQELATATNMAKRFRMCKISLMQSFIREYEAEAKFTEDEDERWEAEMEAEQWRRKAYQLEWESDEEKNSSL